MPSIRGDYLKQLLDKEPVVYASTCVADLDFFPNYDLEEGTLRIIFQARGTYDYKGVPLQVFLDFVASTSQGRYYNYYIRDRYPYEKVA